MKILTFLLFIAFFLTSASSQNCRSTTVIGSGASFPETFYREWIRRLRNNPRVTYRAIGSSSGVGEFTDGDTDFAGTDSPRSAGDLRRLDAVQFPTVGGGVAIAHNNRRGCRSLRLTQRDACDIFLGRRSWSDFDCRCPTDEITVVVRSDGSGTTNVFTQSLSAFCDDFGRQVGSGNEVNWPMGVVRQDGNSGVAEFLRRNRCAIGYVGFGTARAQRLRVAALQNRDRQFVPPTSSSISAGLGGVRLNRVTLSGSNPNPPGRRSYSIVSFTYIVAKKRGNGDKATCIRRAFDFFLSNRAQGRAPRFGFARLPPSAVRVASRAVACIT